MVNFLSFLLSFFILSFTAVKIVHGCRTPDEVTSLAIQAAQGIYEEGVVCGHVGNYYCDCSGLVSYAWGLPAPSVVTQQMQGNYCAKLGSYDELMPGDAILKPDQHVEMFIRWADASKKNYIQAGCHNSQENCSHREVPIANYIGNGYFGCRPHANYVCGGSSMMMNTNKTMVL